MLVIRKILRTYLMNEPLKVFTIFSEVFAKWCEKNRFQLCFIGNGKERLNVH